MSHCWIDADGCYNDCECRCVGCMDARAPTPEKMSREWREKRNQYEHRPAFMPSARPASFWLTPPLKAMHIPIGETVLDFKPMCLFRFERLVLSQFQSTINSGFEDFNPEVVMVVGARTMIGPRSKYGEMRLRELHENSTIFLPSFEYNHRWFMTLKSDVEGYVAIRVEGVGVEPL